MKKIPYTQSGYDELIVEKTKLTTDRETAVIALQQARNMGDLSENAAYKVARSKLSSIDSRLRYVNKLIDWAVIIAPTQSVIIEVGSKVTVEKDTILLDLIVVNTHESDITNGKISYFSPVGRALIGKRVGEKVYVKIPNGNSVYVVKSIS